MAGGSPGGCADGVPTFWYREQSGTVAQNPARAGLTSVIVTGMLLVWRGESHTSIMLPESQTRQAPQLVTKHSRSRSHATRNMHSHQCDLSEYVPFPRQYAGRKGK